MSITKTMSALDMRSNLERFFQELQSKGSVIVSHKRYGEYKIEATPINKLKKGRLLADKLRRSSNNIKKESTFTNNREIYDTYSKY